MADFKKVPEAPGIYMFFLKKTARIETGMSRLNLCLGGSRLVYIGKSDLDIRNRVKTHMLGPSNYSSLRRSLGLSLSGELYVKPIWTRNSFHFGEDEKFLSLWMEDNLCFLSFPHSEASLIERELINSLQPPLNRTGRRDKEELKKHFFFVRRARRDDGPTFH